MPDTSEYEDLDQLLQSAGWTRFQQMVAKEWGTAEGGGTRFVAQVTKAANIVDDPTATAVLRQIIVAQREVQAVMRLCAERYDSLTRHPRPESMSQSRRGTL